MRAALLNADGVVANLILLGEDSDYVPDNGFVMVILPDNATVNIGDHYNGGDWTPPEPTEPEEPVDSRPSMQEQLDSLQATVDMLLLKALE